MTHMRKAKNKEVTMSLEEKLAYKSLNFKFNEDESLTIKSIDEITDQ